MPILLLLTFLFAAVGVFVFLVLMLMLIIGLNGFSSAQAEPWIYGTGLLLFLALNAVSGLLLSLISRRQAVRWSFLVGSGWSALAFVAQLGMAMLLWQLA